MNCQNDEGVIVELDSLNNGFIFEQEDEDNESEKDFYLLADEELKVVAEDEKLFNEKEEEQ